MEISKPDVIFFAIILITGTLTMITDLKAQKIYNNHLIIGALLGLAAMVYSSVWAHEDILFHLGNGAIAFVIGYCFHRYGLWRGGDAKLFTLYAFLMPALEPGHTLFSNAINLFACSFIGGMIILIPLFIKDIASNYNYVITNILPPKKRDALIASVTMTVLFSWVLFPAYYFARMVHIPVLSLVITYVIFNLVHRYLRKTVKLNYVVTAAGIIFGFLMRFWLNPNSLSWPDLPYSIFKIGLFTAFSALIFSTLYLLKEYRDRVAFAPLLFTGCVLCYTPFLTWIMQHAHLIHR